MLTYETDHLALDEGEGFETVADWRHAHEEFWADQGIGDDTLIVAERFRVVERLYQGSGRTREAYADSGGFELGALRAPEWMLRNDSGDRDAKRNDDVGRR